MADKKKILVVVLVLVALYLFFGRKGSSTEETVAEGESASVVAPPATNPPSAPTPTSVTPVAGGPISGVRIVRLQPRDSSSPLVIVGTIQLFDPSGAEVAPVAGYVRSAWPGYSGDWRVLADGNNTTYVHSDGRTDRSAAPGTSEANAVNVAELHYPVGTQGKRLVLYSRSDTIADAPSKMLNLDVLIILTDGKEIRRPLTESMIRPHSTTQIKYDIDLQLWST